MPEIHETVTIVNHEGTAQVVYLVTVECISVVTASHVLTANHACSNVYYVWSGLSKPTSSAFDIYGFHVTSRDIQCIASVRFKNRRI